MVKLHNNHRLSVVSACKRVCERLPVHRSHYRNYRAADVDWLAWFQALHNVQCKRAVLARDYPGIKYTS